MDEEPTTPEAAAPARPSKVVEPRPSRTTSIAVGAIAVVGVIFATTRHPRLPPSAPAVSGGTPAPSATADPSVLAAEEKLEHAVDELKSLPITQSPGAAKLQEALAAVAPSEIGWKMPDGSPAPPLPKDAPKVVRFGIVLIRYAGAQMAPFLSPPKDEARKRAAELALVALTDFPSAVKSGDPGSTADIGTVRRGILEPAIEYTLFTLPKGGVSGVVDTPRGFWVMRRIR